MRDVGLPEDEGQVEQQADQARGRTHPSDKDQSALIVQQTVYRWRAQKWQIRLKDAHSHLTQTRVIETQARVIESTHSSTVHL